jgi:hypothetical protein
LITLVSPLAEKGHKNIGEFGSPVMAGLARPSSHNLKRLVLSGWPPQGAMTMELAET